LTLPFARPSNLKVKDLRHEFVLVNGMTGARRSARPVRLTLAPELGADIDGAWWPYTASLAHELPQLIEALHAPLGEIVDIGINWSITEGPLELYEVAAIARSMRSMRRGRQRLMVIGGRQACARLLVVPHMTTQALGVLVMRCAAARPVSELERESRLFEIADCVMQAAQSESASWTNRMADAANVSVARGPGVEHVGVRQNSTGVAAATE
jgi:hypothetical protein